MLRWLGRSPESFLLRGTGRRRGGGCRPPAPTGASGGTSPTSTRRSPACDASALTWPQLGLLGCMPRQLTGLRRARIAASMNVAMRIVQGLERPAADFVDMAGR